MPRGIQQIHRAVANALHQQAKAFLAAAQLFHGLLMADGFVAQLAVDALELRRRRQGEQARQRHPEQAGSQDGGQGGEALQQPLYPVVRMPQHPDVHEMGGAAGQDEQREQPENPTEGQVSTLDHQPGQFHRDGVVGNAGRQIRQRVQPKQRGLPQ